MCGLIGPRCEGQVKHAMFGLGFVPFFVGVRVGHNAATSAPSESVAVGFRLEKGRPNCHGKFKVFMTEPANSAAVRTSRARLEPVNLVHGHDFGSAGDGPAGKCGGHDVLETDSWAKGCFYFGNGLKDGGMPFNGARLANPNFSRDRHASQIDLQPCPLLQ